VKENFSVTYPAKVVIEVIGEGRTDVGRDETASQPPSPPNTGALPIIVHSLCGKPNEMLVVRRQHASLQGKTRAQKVHFAKRQASCNGSAGVVFVLDSEGDLKERRKELIEGRDRGCPEYPMAVGVAHPCIEAWLLTDAGAIRQGLGLAELPAIPEKSEQLPAPCHNQKNNPKAILRKIAETAKRELCSRDKDSIAALIDLSLLRQRCPLGFAPFADDVDRYIRPLFTKSCSPA
jgi:hypothetical protein